MTQPNAPMDNIQVLVEGTVDYSRIASHIDGNELQRRIERDRSQFPTTTPHTLLELSNIQVYRTGAAGADGYAQPTPGEAFVESKTFTRKNAEKGICLTLENKTKNLPALLTRNAETGAYEQVVRPEGEIAPGTRVQAVLRVFHVAKYNKQGINLEAVLVSTPEVPYASGRGLDLSAYGIELAGPIVATEAATSGQSQAQAPADVSVTTDAATGLPAAPQPQQAQQAPQAPAQPMQQGFAQQPAQQAPAAPVVPPAAQYQVPQPHPGQQAPQPPAQQADPFAGQNPQWAGQGQGIVAPE